MTIRTDYAVTLEDRTGRRVPVYINADSITELMATGLSEDRAAEEVEQNAFQNAIARGEISEDCWIA